MTPRPYAVYRSASDTWFPPAPSHWNDAPVWTLFTREARKGFADETLLSVYRDHGVVPKDSRDDNNNRASEDLSTYQLVEPGDLVVNKMKAWQGSLSISRFRGIVSPAYFVYRPHHHADDRFLHHLLRSRPLIAAYIGMSKGVRVSQWDLEPQNFSRLKLALPPRKEQEAIADYLDRETARIDMLIEEQQRLVEMLRERRDAAWAHLYAKAQETGATVPLRRVLESIVDGPFGSSLTSAHYSDQGARVIRLGNIGINEFRDTDAAFISLEYAVQLEAHSVVGGDVVIAGLGDERMPLGRAAVVPDLGPAIVKADCYRARPTPAVEPAYLAWALSAPATRTAIALLARGATRARLNTSVVREVEIPVPPKSEQVALLSASAEQTAKIDTLIAESERFIELARERRAALTTAAVTGQIDVRNEVAC